MTLKPRQKGGLLRFFAFFLIPAVVIVLANTFLLEADAISYYTYREIESREDIDLAIIGSSIVFNNLNPQTITEITGKEAFDVGCSFVNLQGIEASAKFLFRTNQPEWVLVITEPDMLIDPAENIQAQQRLMSCLKDPRLTIPYYFDLCSQDHAYIDRLLMFKSLFIKSPKDIGKRFMLWNDPRGYYEQSTLKNGDNQYMGEGYVRTLKETSAQKVMQEQGVRPFLADADPSLLPYTQKKLLQIKKECEKNGSKLIVGVTPSLTARNIAEQGYMENNASLAAFCDENDIHFLDFSMMKPAYMPRLDEYFLDWVHLNAEGSEVYSQGFGECLKRFMAGESVDHMFYGSKAEYLDDIDFIASTWVTETLGNVQDTYTAFSNRGTDVVPEYSFSVQNEDGSLTMVRDFSTDPVFTCPAGSYRNRYFYVTARAQGDPAAKTMSYKLVLPRVVF